MFLHILGKFRHLSVDGNGDVIAMQDIAKRLYDAISRMEKAAEQGSEIAAAVEGVESIGRQLSGFSFTQHILSASSQFCSKYTCSLYGIVYD
jgi:hypothetical protein